MVYVLFGMYNGKARANVVMDLLSMFMYYSIDQAMCWCLKFCGTAIRNNKSSVLQFDVGSDYTM